MVKYAAAGIWCDLCKQQWGKDKYKNWHPRAQKQAWITEISEGIRAKGLTRSLCHPCAALITDNPTITLAEFTYLHLLGQEFQAKFTQGELINV